MTTTESALAMWLKAAEEAIANDAESAFHTIDARLGDLLDREQRRAAQVQADAAAKAATTPLVVIHGTVRDFSFEFPAVIGKPGADLGPIQPTTFVMDTGAFEMALDTTVAQALGLPNLGAAEVGGVGGQATAYNTRVDLQLGWPTIEPTVYRDISAVAIEGFGQNLFGLRFFINHGLCLTLDPAKSTLTIAKG